MKRFGMIGLLTLCVAASAGAQQSGAGKSDEVPAEYKPPKGMCRIWLKDVPPKQQPAPTDCPTAVKNLPQNGRVIFGDGVSKKEEKPKTQLPPPKGYTGRGGPPPIKIKPPAI
jgi:hypothetical protein